MSDAWNAVITEVEPGDGAPGPLHGQAAARQGPDRHRRDPHDVRLEDLRRPRADAHGAARCERLVDAGAVVVGKANLHEFAWGVTSQNPWYGTVQNPRHPGRTTGGSSGGNAAALAAGLCDIGLGTDTGCSIRLPAACCDLVGLKPSWGAHPDRRRLPALPDASTPSARWRTSVADVALMWSVLAGGAGARAAPRRADRRPADAAAVGRRARPPPRTAPPSSTSSGSRSSARASSRRRFPSRPTTRGRSSSTRRPSRIARRFPARADEYGDNVRAKLEHAQTIEPPRSSARARLCARWREYRPPVDLYVAPVLGVELPPEDCDELEVRIPLTAFLRPFNVLGWAGLAIGDLQLVAPRDEVVLAAGLAWEGPTA